MTPITGTMELREFEPPGIGKRWFYRIAQYPVSTEHIYETKPCEELLNALRNKKIDIFSFIERSFIEDSTRKERARLNIFNHTETIGLLHVTSFDEWLKSIGHHARFIRKGQRMGLRVRLVNIDEEFIKSAARIYNETPVRQGRKYSGYGLSLAEVRAKFSRMYDSEVIGAYSNNELVGLIWVGYGDRVAALKSFLSLITCRKKCPNNLLLAETVRRCCERGYTFLTYGNMGYNPGLDFFKTTNGFRVFPIPRYYLPLTAKGQLAIKLRLYQSLEHSFSPTLTRALVPFYNKLSRLLPIDSDGHSSA